MIKSLFILTALLMLIAACGSNNLKIEPIQSDSVTAVKIYSHDSILIIDGKLCGKEKIGVWNYFSFDGGLLKSETYSKTSDGVQESFIDYYASDHILIARERITGGQKNIIFLGDGCNSLKSKTAMNAFVLTSCGNCHYRENHSLDSISKRRTQDWLVLATCNFDSLIKIKDSAATRLYKANPDVMKQHNNKHVTPEQALEIIHYIESGKFQ